MVRLPEHRQDREAGEECRQPPQGVIELGEAFRHGIERDHQQGHRECERGIDEGFQPGDLFAALAHASIDRQCGQVHRIVPWGSAAMVIRIDPVATLRP